MINRLGINKKLWILAGLMSLAAAITGVVNSGIYSGLAGEQNMPGVMSQDLVTIAAAAVVVLLAVITRQDGARLQIVILGLLGYLFYAYGIYVIERFYNKLYFIYMTIFALTFYSLVYGVANISGNIVRQVRVPDRLRNVSVAFSLLIPALFTTLWVGMLWPLIQTREKAEFMYSIYILDICFLFPAFVIIAVMAAGKRGFGLLLLPTVFIWGFTLLFSVALGGLLKPLYNQAVNMGEIWLYLGVSIVFLSLAVIYLRNLKIVDR